VIVHYATPELLARCLAAVRAGTASLIAETFVVDNASRGFNRATVEDALPGAHVVANDRNAGFTVAANQGIALPPGVTCS
jgi:GT2 family glycosyltransferase